MHRLLKRLGILTACFITASSIADASSPAAGLDLVAHRGKVVLVDFWASWCVPCRRSFPWMNEMQARYGDAGLVVIAVNLDENPDDAGAFLDEHPADFTIAYDPDGRLAAAFGVVAMPSSYVFDREGNEVARHLGFRFRDREDYEAVLIEALER